VQVWWLMLISWFVLHEALFHCFDCFENEGRNYFNLLFTLFGVIALLSETNQCLLILRFVHGKSFFFPLFLAVVHSHPLFEKHLTEEKREERLQVPNHSSYLLTTQFVFLGASSFSYNLE
jgi:hypothetical protein